MSVARTCPWWAVVLGPGLLLGAGSAQAADKASANDKIQFSTPAKSLQLPDSAAQGRELSSKFELLDKRNSLGGAIEPLTGGAGAPPPAPQQPNQRLLEFLEQKTDERRNWIYNRPDEYSLLKGSPQSLSLWDTSLDSDGSKSKSRLAAFFEGKETSKTTERARSSLTPADATSELTGATPLSQFDRNTPLEVTTEWRPMGPNGPVVQNQSGRLLQAGMPAIPDFGGGSTRLSGFGGPAGLSTLTPGSPLPKPSSPPNDISQIFDAQYGVNPLVTGFDPINLRVDNTRQELNPVTPRRPGDLSVQAGTKLVESGQVFNDPNARTPLSTLDQLNMKVLGPSSLSPAVPAPPAPAPSSPRALRLEFPQRKF